MIIVITMAGLGTRFRKAGYNCPKYMIEAKGKTLFEWSMDSLVNYNENVSKYVFVVKKEDNASDFIIEKCKKYNIPEVEIRELDYVTDGQATTALFGLENCSDAEALMIYNIDTYIEPNNLKYSDISGDGFIPCFNAEGTHWSFVKLDIKGNAIEVAEKRRISNNCTLGAYYFKSVKLYKDIYFSFFNDEANCNVEKYIAPMYNYMIKNGYKINICDIDFDSVHVLGTPEELETFINN